MLARKRYKNTFSQALNSFPGMMRTRNSVDGGFTGSCAHACARWLCICSLAVYAADTKKWDATCLRSMHVEDVRVGFGAEAG